LPCEIRVTIIERLKQKFETLRETLDEFAQQDEYPMLLVGCRSQEIAYVHLFVKGLDQTLPSHLVAPFQQPFRDPAQWLDEMVGSLTAQLEVLGPERAKRGEPPCPPLPLALHDRRCPPPQRLEALLRYVVDLLPNSEDYRAVVGLLPLECKDVRAYSELVAPLVPHPQIPAWMANLRLIVWDDQEHMLLRNAVHQWQAKHVLTYADDFSTPALTDSLGKDAANTDLSLEQRLLSLQQLAALDLAYKRYGDALDKYALLHEHHHQRGEPELQALALLGAGDTLAAAGDPKTAKVRLQQGIAVAMECKSLPVLSNLLTSVIGVSMVLGEYADAESYADSGTKVAATSLNPFTYADFHQFLGDAQFAQRKLDDAVRSYTRCRELCRTYEHFSRWLEAIDQQARIYAEARGSQQVDAQLRILEDERAVVVELQRRKGAAA
jgi:tetratricopeptide (TPR) repeat protein